MYRKTLVIAIALVAALSICTSLADASAGRSTRSLLQSWTDPWSGPSWGFTPYPGFGWGGYWARRPSDPVGSGCYHPETLTRYRHGQVAYCDNGYTMRCNWGDWSGSCYDHDWVN